MSKWCRLQRRISASPVSGPRGQPEEVSANSVQFRELTSSSPFSQNRDSLGGRQQEKKKTPRGSSRSSAWRFSVVVGDCRFRRVRTRAVIMRGSSLGRVLFAHQERNRRNESTANGGESEDAGRKHPAGRNINGAACISKRLGTGSVRGTLFTRTVRPPYPLLSISWIPPPLSLRLRIFLFFPSRRFRRLTSRCPSFRCLPSSLIASRHKPRCVAVYPFLRI